MKHDEINHIELRSDIENDNIDLNTLVAEGKISNEPETWAIDYADGGSSYLYESKYEYDQDLKTLKL